MIVQIYSLMNVQEAVACAQAGADHIGVLVSRTLDGRYPCEVLPEDAKTIFAALRGLAKRVLISIEPDQESVLKMTEELQPDILHLCADFHGSPAFRALLRQRCPHTELMEAVGVRDESAIADALAKAAYADYLILDTIPLDNPGIGAAGETHDWSIDQKIIEQVQIPVIEAGGLDADNVQEAIRRLHPWGVDSCTRTSIKKDGRIIGKDLEKVRAFCARAKAV